MVFRDFLDVTTKSQGIGQVLRRNVEAAFISGVATRS